jgi:hypothetical protein
VTAQFSRQLDQQLRTTPLMPSAIEHILQDLPCSSSEIAHTVTRKPTAAKRGEIVCSTETEASVETDKMPCRWPTQRSARLCDSNTKIKDLTPTATFQSAAKFSTICNVHLPW